MDSDQGHVSGVGGPDVLCHVARSGKCVVSISSLLLCAYERVPDWANMEMMHTKHARLGKSGAERFRNGGDWPRNWSTRAYPLPTNLVCNPYQTGFRPFLNPSQAFCSHKQTSNTRLTIHMNDARRRGNGETRLLQPPFRKEASDQKISQTGTGSANERGSRGPDRGPPGPRDPGPAPSCDRYERQS